MSHRADSLNDIFENNVTVRGTLTSEGVEVAKVIKGTGDPPDASTVPEGTIFIQYVE